jgi:hypothetical protein
MVERISSDIPTGSETNHQPPLPGDSQSSEAKAYVMGPDMKGQNYSGTSSERKRDDGLAGMTVWIPAFAGMTGLRVSSAHGTLT